MEYMAKSKFYTVRKGHTPGVYASWAECQAQVNGFKGAEFKSFATKELAEVALVNGWETGANSEKKEKSQEKEPTKTSDYHTDSISVDAACSGNPGEMEYQGVDTATGEQLFASPLYPIGTNNIGEFLAIVDGLKYLQEQQSNQIIYSDSISAIAWVRNKRVKTNLVRNPETEALWQAIDQAVEWLWDNSYTNPVLKWETKIWGEVKADFGRK